jgi:hypothetical protein
MGSEDPLEFRARNAKKWSPFKINNCKNFVVEERDLARSIGSGIIEPDPNPDLDLDLTSFTRKSV